MKKFTVKVNGVAYDVEVEESGAGRALDVRPAALAPAVPAPPPVQAASAAAPVPEAPPPKPAPAAGAGKKGSEMILAPMPGTILRVEVEPGQAVKKNQVLCILEAMKMENEIVTPREGVVAGVHTDKGAIVQAGTPLVSLE